jgi:influenza virus NS1A-binding protein
MLEPRRGCGAAVHKDSQSIYIVGGTNGSQSLRSVEIYDIKSKRWTLGPELNVARTNVAIAFIGKFLSFKILCQKNKE